MDTNKCVIIIDSELPTGLIANTAAVLALTLGKHVEGIIGPDLTDAEGRNHVGITTTPIPILKSTKEDIKKIRNDLYSDESSVFVVDFSDAAQTTKNYDEYTNKISTYATQDLTYLGIALFGQKKKINKLTGSMALLR